MIWITYRCASPKDENDCLGYILAGIDREDVGFVYLRYQKRKFYQDILSRFNWILRRFPDLFLDQRTVTELKQVKDGDTFVVIDDVHSYALRCMNALLGKEVKKHLFFWTPLSQILKKNSERRRRNRVRERAKRFALSSFDMGDHLMYKEVGYLGSFYCKSRESKEVEADYDFYFCGREKGRSAILSELKSQIELQDFSFRCMILPETSVISYKENIANTQKCRCLVDIVLDQKGLSLRPKEALFLGKKLMTNNVCIMDEPLYNPANVFVIGVDDMKDLPKFMNTPMVEIDESVKEMYDINNWLNHFES